MYITLNIIYHIDMDVYSIHICMASAAACQRRVAVSVAAYQIGVIIAIFGPLSQTRTIY